MKLTAHGAIAACPEAATTDVLGKKMFLEISQNSQACNFMKKESLAQVFFCGFCEISKNTFFTEHLWTAASLYEGGCVKELFSSTCSLASRNFIKD